MSYNPMNNGALFKNADKKTDNHPDYRGTIMVSPELAGKEVNIAAWLKESGPQSKKPGTKYMSLSVSEMRPATTQSATAAPANDLPFDDIPF